MKVNISIILKSFEIPEANQNKSKIDVYSSQNFGGCFNKNNSSFAQNTGSKAISAQSDTHLIQADSFLGTKGKNLSVDFNKLSIRLPRKQSLYTVLRSPHIDKKSREQFNMKIHKQLIRITASTFDLGSKLFNFKFHELSGVQMKVIFQYKTRLSK